MTMIGIAASLTAEPLIPHLKTYLQSRGLKEARIQVAPFNQINQTCRNVKKAFGETPDILIILWRLDDLVDGGHDNPAILSAAVDDFVSSLRALRKSFSGTILVSLPPHPFFCVQALTSVEQNGFLASVANQICREAIEKIKSIDSLYLFDLNQLMLKFGFDRAHDARKWFLYRQPWSEGFWKLLATQVGRLISATRLPSKKCIVLDADNTLWGGTIGEDGLEGISLGQDFPGNVHVAFQRELLALQKKGVLLAVASKNNPDDFFEVLDRHDAMVLKRKDFVAFEVHWKSKAESIRTIAKTLNIATDSIVFIDDNPKEIDEVKSLVPDVICLQVPEEIVDLPRLLQESDLFDSLEVTEEDLKRTEMLHATGHREAAQATLSESEFLASLKLELHVFKPQKEHLARVVQLINKTNQFNLTTKRRTLEEVQLLLNSPDYMILCLNLKDKYGDYGLVGAAILKIADDVCFIDSLLMSCRALGRGAEVQFLQEIAKLSACSTIQGQFIPTPKNQLAADFYKDAGFSYNSQSNVWVCSSKAVLVK